VDLKADALAKASACDDMIKRRTKMDRFVKEHIYHWIYEICVHAPESKFVFIGTKADLIDYDTKKIEAISADLSKHIQRMEKPVLEMRRQASIVQNDSKMLELLGQRNSRILSKKILIFSSADLHGLEETDRTLQHLIVDSNTSFQMPASYVKMGDYLRKKATDAMRSNSINKQIHSSIVSVD
jgi:hypothetical protein